MGQISDGASRTVAIVEATPENAVPWTKPADLPYDPQKPLPKLGESALKAVTALSDGQALRSTPPKIRESGERAPLMSSENGPPCRLPMLSLVAEIPSTRMELPSVMYRSPVTVEVEA